MAVLVLPRECWDRIVAHCLGELPLEACGLVAGTTRPGWYPEAALAVVSQVYPASNSARSARLYTVEPADLLRADRSAEAAGLSLIGVWHSHTHTPAYPSPTDIAQAPDPDWHYLLVSLADSEPVLRSYRVVDGVVSEEPVAGAV
ncbi:MAG TPA: M67 family metallopeptidase [Acidimicrobiales bacterium]|nr:M67 family metallopeptidase [Acidimicrobiales bacterium]